MVRQNTTKKLNKETASDRKDVSQKPSWHCIIQPERNITFSSRETGMIDPVPISPQCSSERNVGMEAIKLSGKEYKLSPSIVEQCAIDYSTLRIHSTYISAHAAILVEMGDGGKENPRREKRLTLPPEQTDCVWHTLGRCNS